jgi:hypothetical protein
VNKLLAAWLCVALVACAMGGKKSAMAPAPAAQSGATPAAPQTPEEKHAAIEKLSNDIATEQQKQTAMPSAPTPMSAGSQTCTDVCTLKTSICDNAKQICKLAEELQPDEWATGKCNDANQACTDATKRCTDCGA